ncbi:MAG TPA: hypothetical protein VKY44_08905 [Flavobacterium sp.]|nr:hypothetical protein [Flavobacterium sp.]
MKTFFTILGVFMAWTLFAQTNFEYGHYIDVAGNKIETEVSELSIDRFPEKIFIRKGSTIEEIDLSNVSEVKWGTAVFQKKRFYYDPTLRQDIDKLTEKENFEFVEKTDFVQLLTTGDYKLYQYVENGISTFIYETPEGMLVTLEHKKYLGQNRSVLINTNYVNQLFENAKNPKYGTQNDYSLLKYTIQDLQQYFKEVNGKSYVKIKKSRTRFNLFAGYAVHTMDIDFLSDIPGKTYGSLTVVPEVEYTPNRHLKNPTSFYANVKLHRFKNDFVEEYERENWNHKVDYQSLYVSLGVKQYFLSNKKVAYYGKLGVGLNNPIKSEIKSPIDSWRLNLILLDRYGAGINAGLGARFFDSFLAEVDYDFVFANSNINQNFVLNFKLGYSF